MKKLILLVVMAAMALVGCQKSELVGPTGSNDVFIATVEGFGSQTKTSLTPENYVVWSADDRLAIFQGSAIADEYQLADGCDGLNGGSFKWVAKDNVVNDDFTAGTELPCNVAYYPYSQGLILKGDMQDDGKKIFTLANVMFPEIQYYAENSFGNGSFPMVAVTANVADHNLKFKNIGGAMKLQLKGFMAVKSIKIEGANGERLSGAATVTAYANNLTPAITMTGTDEASKSVTLDCGDGVQLNAIEATDFFIALPPVLFQNGFTVIVTDVEEKEYTVTATDANTVLRSSILVMPKVFFGDSGEGASRDYVDEYGINHGKGTAIGGAVWAPVNCGYHATDYKWGKLYQWGRKYGQGYDGDATTPELSESGVSLQGGQSSNNENVFFTCPDFPYDWLYQGDDQLWNSGTEDSPVKTEYDPCPEGWRVPTFAELEELSINHSEWTINENSQLGYWFSGSSSYSSEVAQVFFPAAGCRLYDGEAGLRGWDGVYWSSRPGSDTAGSLGFYSGNDGAYMGIGYRADGYSVRCVQNMSDESIPVSSIELNLKSLNLQEGDVQQLTATVSPQDATDKSVVWSSSDASVATVDQTGRVTAVSAGSATITAVAGVKSAFCTVTVSALAVATLDYIDEYGINHGQGVKIGETVWAPVNCGYHATDYQWGKLYQWGRKYGQGYDGDATTPDFSEGGVSLQGGQSDGNKNIFFKESSDWLYSQNDALWNSGTEDSPVKTEYDPCPTGWRVPTYAELSELYRNRSSWTANDLGQSGYWFSGPSSYSSEVAQVFFPAAGCRDYYNGYAYNRGNLGFYWSSRPINHVAYRLGFESSYAIMRGSDRADGYSVRCVQE